MPGLSWIGHSGSFKFTVFRSWGGARRDAELCRLCYKQELGVVMEVGQFLVLPTYLFSGLPFNRHERQGQRRQCMKTG